MAGLRLRGEPRQRQKARFKKPEHGVSFGKGSKPTHQFGERCNLPQRLLGTSRPINVFLHSSYCRLPHTDAVFLPVSMAPSVFIYLFIYLFIYRI